MASRLLHVCRTQPNPLEALMALHALHAGPAQLGLRTGFVGRGSRLYPPPTELPAMLSLLFERLRRNFEQVQSLGDELLNFALAFYGVTAIHPFADHNGETALDFVQYLTMRRFGLAAPAFEFPDETKGTLGRVCSTLEPECDGSSAEDLLRLHDAICRNIGQGDVAQLRASPVFLDLQRCLAVCLKVELPATQGREQVDFMSLRSR